jgi:hypothetical protein
VGIAGEDDLDAPDLDATGPAAAPKAEPDQPTGPNGHKPNGHAVAAGPPAPGAVRDRTPLVRLAKPVLAADQSAALRDRLIAELDGLRSTDDAATWAHRSLPAKNTLTGADAELVEDGFRATLAAFGEGRPDQPVPQPNVPPPQVQASSTASTESPAPDVDTADSGLHTDSPRKNTGELDDADSRSGRIDKSLLAISEPRRIRDKAHRQFVSSQACLVCGRQPSDPHHLRFAQPRALSRKVSDEFTVPLCRIHHREVHRGGNEAAWWSGFSIDPCAIAAALWMQTRPRG